MPLRQLHLRSSDKEERESIPTTSSSAPKIERQKSLRAPRTPRTPTTTPMVGGNPPGFRWAARTTTAPSRSSSTSSVQHRQQYPPSQTHHHQHHNSTANESLLRSSSPIMPSTKKPEAAATTLTDIEALAFLFLWWRAIDALSPYPILNDPYAASTWSRCKADDMRHPWMRFPSDQRWVNFICHRTRTIDLWTQEFIDRNVEGQGVDVQVVHVGCGLDARNLRVRWGRGVRWVDVDLPAVTDLRRRVMERPEGWKDYSLRTLDITVEGWFRDSKFTPGGPRG